MISLLEKFSSGTCAVLLVLTLLLFVSLTFYTYPQVDDFCIAALTRLPFSDIIREFFDKWNGRIVANLAMALPYFLAKFLAIDTVSAYRLVVLLVFAGLAVTFLLVAKLLLPNSGRTDRALAALGLSVLYIVSMPSITQGIYWVSGMTTYVVHLPFLAVLLFVSQRIIHTGAVRIRWIAVLLPCVLVLGSVTETLAVAEVAVLVVTLIVGRVQGIATRQLVLIVLLLVAALATFYLNVSAPASQARAAGGGFSSVLGYAISAVLGGISSVTIGLEFLTPALVAMAALFAAYALKAEQAAAGAGGIHAYDFVLPVLLILLLPACLVMGFIATQVVLPARALNILYFFFLVGVVWSAQLYVRREADGVFAAATMAGRLLRHGRAVPVLVALTTATIIFDRSVPEAAYNLFIEGPRFSTAMAHRWQLLQGPGKTVVLPMADHRSRMLEFLPDSGNPRALSNQCMAEYFGKGSVRVNVR